jgi:HTH-type transcriptional regulator/antitoxin HigA
MTRLISDDEGHASALAELDRLLDLDPRPDSPEADELQLLALVIEIYEQRRWPIPLPDPVDAILFVMDQQGLTRRDLQRCLGSRSRVSEVLSRKRSLSLRMVRALHKEFGIPFEVLVQETGRAA